jgi:hypothetical protein
MQSALLSSEPRCARLVVRLISAAFVATAIYVSAADSSAAEPSLADPGLTTHLILDEHSVAEADGIAFEMTTAKKHPENPVLLPGKPGQWDSLQVIWPGTVLYSETDRKFRCWYSGLDAIQSKRPPFWVAGYAESEDGVHWTKPELGQIDYENEPTNRLKFDAGVVNSFVIENPDESDPDRRFLSFWIGHEPDRMTKNLGSSPDGRTWKDEGVVYRPATPERRDYVDICQCVMQPDAANLDDRCLAYGQVVVGPRMTRQIGLLHGPDISSLKLSGASVEQSVILAPEPGIDEQVHFASVRKSGDVFLMLFESDRFSATPPNGDLRLAVSEDGHTFRRIHPHTPLVATGVKGMWDANLLATTTSSMQVVGDEIWIYYFGTPDVFTSWPGEHAKRGELRGSMFYPCCLGVATLPRDRFASATGPGQLTTKPMTLSSRGLWLNADGDEIHVTALDATGAAVADGRIEAGDTLYRRVQWTGEPPIGEVSVRVSLDPGQRLYSLQH